MTELAVNYEDLMNPSSSFFEGIKELQTNFWLKEGYLRSQEILKEKGIDDREHTDRDLSFLREIMQLKGIEEGSREWVLNEVVLELHDITKQWSPAEIFKILESCDFEESKIGEIFENRLPETWKKMNEGRGAKSTQGGEYSGSEVFLMHNQLGAVVAEIFLKQQQERGISIEDEDVEYVTNSIRKHHFPPSFFMEQAVRFINGFGDLSPVEQEDKLSLILPAIESHEVDLNITADAMDMVDGRKIAWFSVGDGFEDTFRGALASAAGSSIESVVLPLMLDEEDGLEQFGQSSFTKMRTALSSFYDPEYLEVMQFELDTVWNEAKLLAENLRRIGDYSNIYLEWERFRDLRRSITNVFNKYPIRDDVETKNGEFRAHVVNGDFNLKPRDPENEKKFLSPQDSRYEEFRRDLLPQCKSLIDEAYARVDAGVEES